MKLWIFLLIGLLCASMVSATILVTDNINFSLLSSTSDTTYAGTIISVNNSAYLYSVGLASGDTALNVRVYSGNSSVIGTLLTTSDISIGSVRYFSNPIFLTKGSNYWIQAGSEGASYTQIYNASINVYPRNRVNINFINDSSGSSAGGNTAYNVINMTTSTLNNLIPVVLEGSSQSYYLNATFNLSLGQRIDYITFNYSGTLTTPAIQNTSVQDNISSNIYYVSQSVPLITSSSNNITQNVSWIYNITNGSVTTNFSSLDTQEVHRMLLTNCSVGTASTTQTINLSALDFQTNVSLSANYSSNFLIWSGTPSLSRDYGFVVSNTFTQATCLYPTWANVRSDFSTDVLRNGYASNRLVKYSFLLNNTVNLQSIFLMNSNNVVARNVIVQNNVGQGLSGYLVNVFRFNVGNGLYDYVGSRVSDSGGITLFYLITDGYQYRINVVNATNSELAGIGPMDLTYSPIYITLKNIGNAFTKLNNLVKARNIITSLTNNNVTRIVTLFYNDPLNVSNSMCLQVWNNFTQVNQSCSSQKTDTLQYSYGAINGTMIAYSVADIIGGSPYTIDTLIVDLDKLGPFGSDGGPSSLIVIGTMSILGALAGKQIGDEVIGALIFTIASVVFLVVTGILAVYSSTMTIVITTIVIMFVIIIGKSVR